MKIILMILSVSALSVSMAAHLYVDLNGSDTNPGTKEKPVATLSRARDLIQPHVGKQPITVHLADGTYYLPETLLFTPEDSGTVKMPIIYKSENEGGAVLSGGSKLDLIWKLNRDGIFQAQTPKGLEIDQLFIDGNNQRMARYPNYDPAQKTQPYQGYSADAFSKERAANWADPAGGYIHAMHRSQWGGYHYLITGKDTNGDVIYEGGWQNNRKSGMHKEFRMVENIFEELDAPGEWFHNEKTSMLYYKPAEGVDLKTASVEVVRLRHLVEFQGSEKSPVKFITFQGFTVRHAARTFMDCKEQMLRSDWAIYRGGAFMLTGTEDIQILDSEFDQVGGNAVFVNNYNRRTRVKGCHIHDTGASGVCFVGDPDAVRNPLFEYGEKNDLAKIDRTVGPKSTNFPSLGTVEDCLIHSIGRTERQPAGVMMEMAQEITVRDCSIYDCARSGINIGDGCWGGHLIERCDVFDTVLETHDHGSFNSWGRDRYWRSDQPTSQAAVDAEPELPFLDAMKTTTIRDSRWRCDHGWDIDLDDGSSNYDIYNNLLLNTGLKLREGFRRHAWNNVIPFGSLHPHVWYNKSKDQVYNNIFSAKHRPARMNSPYVDETMVDRNFFNMSDESAIKAAAKLGWDENSVYGDPMFVDPAKGDFRVQDGSPAFALGFKNFPMDQFGVKKPSLKAIAETPKIPMPGKPEVKVQKKEKSEVAALKKVWLGAILEDLEGEAFSAYGVSKEEGGAALKNAPTGTHLKAGDLIQGVNGTPVKNAGQFMKVLATTGTAPLVLKVVRNQKVIEVKVQPASTIEVEAVSAADGFTKLPVPPASRRAITANLKSSNEPLSTLADGKLAENFGSVFGNGMLGGMYKMDLGKSGIVSAVTSWAHNQSKRRGAQKLTIYGSNASADPGWDLNEFTALGTIVTDTSKAKFTVASLRAVDEKALGTFRWIIWAVAPVSDLGGGENTAFQELAVETLGGGQAEPIVIDNRPNIIFVMTDDQRWDTLGCYGRTDVRTPHIDKLAAEGVVFDNAYYAVAICMPSRVTMFTGRYFADHQSGFTYPYNRTLPKEEFAESYPAKLREAGYRTGFVGKFGIRLENVPKTAPAHFDFFVNGENVLVPKNDAGLKNIYRRDRPKNERTLKKGDAMIRFLETQPEGQPFCFSISFDAVKNDRDSDMYPPHVKLFEGQEMWVPPNWVEGKNHELPKVLDHCRGTYLHVARTSTPEEYQRRARRFAVQGYTVDVQVGRLMAKLEEMGELDNTIVIYTSDNGRFHGSHGLFDKCILYDESMKEPIIVFDGRAPESKCGRRENAMVSSVDVAPTILSFAGVKAPEIMKGRDLTGILNGTQDMSQWRDAVLMENLFIQELHSAGVKKHSDIPGLNDELIAGNRSYRTRGVRTERFKYFIYNEHDPVIEELYDLQADPQEQDNLITDPEYAQVLSKLRKKTEELYADATE